jgi:hypothetical protein
MKAAYNGHERVVSLLIERGANLDIQNKVRINIIILFFSFIFSKEHLPFKLQECGRILIVFVHWKSIRFGLNGRISSPFSLNFPIPSLLLIM